MADDHIKERLEHIEQRLEAMEAMLKELIRLAHLNWMYRSEEEKEAVRKEMEERYKDPAFFSGSTYAAKLPKQTKLRAREEAPDLSDVWEPGETSDPNEKYYAQDDTDPYKGFYERDDAEKLEVKKGEIKAQGVPQKGRVGKAKSQKRTGAPDYG